ncbi:uncharacterized protein V6R79_018425 [Siganus canaliculatus]
MDCKLNGRLNHSVLVLLLLWVQWRPVFLAPLNNCLHDLQPTQSFRSLLLQLRSETEELLEKYVYVHGSIAGSVPKDVPSSTISKAPRSEKQQEMYFKAREFYLHILKVEEYQKEVWGNPDSVQKPLSLVKGNLENLIATIKNLIGEEDSPLPTPASPQLSHKHDYQKKVYGWGVIASLKDLITEMLQDEANGKNIGTWSPGFPELQVQKNGSLNGSNVQCSLFFMGEGLKKILDDQRGNLNPEDRSLHEKLQDAIVKVNALAVCLSKILGGECSSKPSPPEMPMHMFERKQWSHTLLKTSRDYLKWLWFKLDVQVSVVFNKNQLKHKGQTYLEGSGHVL